MGKQPTKRQFRPELQAIIDEYPMFITYPQAAEITTVSARTLKRETADGRLPCFRVGRSRTLRVRTADVLALIEQVA